MSNPFVGQIEIFAFNFAPKNWALCNGQILSIQQNQVLFSLLGTTYGGNGFTTFALPNLQSRVPIHMDGSNYVLGQVGGTETVALTAAQIASHTHSLTADNTQNNVHDTYTPASNTVLGQSQAKSSTGNSSNVSIYGAGTGSTAAMDSHTIGSQGGQAHTNLMPYLCVSICICIFGIYPSRT